MVSKCLQGTLKAALNMLFKVWTNAINSYFAKINGKNNKNYLSNKKCFIQ